MSLIVAKVVDDIKVAEPVDNAVHFLSSLNNTFKLGTINSGPGNLRVFGINVVQHENMEIETNADDKIESLFEYVVFRHRRKQYDSLVNDVEKQSFMSMNSSHGWIDSAASPL